MSRFAVHRPRPRHLLVAAALCPLFAVVHFAVYWLRFEGQLTASEINQFTTTLCGVVLTKLFAFGWYGIHQGWGRYVTFHDIVVLTKATTVGAILTACVDYLFVSSVVVPRSVFLMDWGATIMVVGGLRSAIRLIDERSLGTFLVDGQRPVFIVGANDSGEALLRAIRRGFRTMYRVVAFIADDPSAVRSQIGGIPVIGTLAETCSLAAKHGVSEVFMTAGELPGQDVRRLVEDGREHNVTVKVLPSFGQLLHGHVRLRPREVSIEDLLRRDSVELNLAGLHQWIDDRVLLVTGSAGSIGAEICRQLLRFSPRKLIVVDQSETGQFFLERELAELAPDCEVVVSVGDIRDTLRMNHIFATHQPDIVFHAAAYKHVPLMESNPGEGILNIAVASRRLAELANRHGVRSFVMISTDKAVNPTSVMGTCKRVAELYVQALAATSRCRFVTVRFGNVLDSAGSVVPIFRKQIEEGGPITVTHPEMRRFFMTIPEASQLVIQAGAMGQGGEIFVLDMGEPVKIVDLAEDMIRLSGLRVGEDIPIEFIGNRPGEKLYEELNAQGEQHVPTSHAKIRIAASAPRKLATIRRQIDQLTLLVNAPKSEILVALKEIVPEFQHEAIEAAAPEAALQLPAAA